MTAGIVIRYAGPAISITAHTPVITHPIGPVSIAAILVIPAIVANLNPCPNNAVCKFYW